MRDRLVLISLFTIVSAVFYGYYYFFGSGRLNTVYKNWDGPSYVITALSLYDPVIASSNNIIQSKDITPDWTFLPAHFPLYPLLIRLLSPLGYFQAMIFLSVLASLLSLLALYELFRRHRLTKYPLLAAIPFIFLTPRWFVVSHVGGSEPLFLFFLILFLNLLLKGRHGSAAVMAAFAQLTRPQGALIGVAMLAICLYELVKTRDLTKIVRTYYPYLLIPAALLGVFTFYYFRTGDFLAFFSSISIFRHTSLLPFSTFSFPSDNVETFWQEVNAWDYFLYLTAVIILLKSRLWQLGVIGLTFYLPLIFLRHSDISRYALPILPLVFIAYRDLIARREFTLATLLASPAIFRYAVNFMEFNHGV